VYCIVLVVLCLFGLLCVTLVPRRDALQFVTADGTVFGLEALSALCVACVWMRGVLQCVAA